ncbi:MAG: peptidylprolyl isomerase [Pirellulaceae bacterium]
MFASLNLLKSTTLRMVIGAVSLFLFQATGVGQLLAFQAPESSPAETQEESNANKSFSELLIEWQNLQTELAQVKADFDKTEDDVERDSLRREYTTLIQKAITRVDQLREAGLMELQNSELTPVLTRNLLGIMVNDANDGRDAEVLTTADILIAKGIDPKYWETAASLERLSIPAREIFEEIAIRHREHEANDLPQATIVTNRGTITVELYENEAPNTVANFISLSKAGFFNGLTFHRVIDGFMAQTGSPKGDGSDGPGYKIADECRTPESRRHFTGVLSMANAGANTNTNGSQFFITFSRSTAVQSLDNKHTVFGRIITGMDVLQALTRTNEIIGSQELKIEGAEPDKVEKIEITRDRGHKYEVQKVAVEETDAAEASDAVTDEAKSGDAAEGVDSAKEEDGSGGEAETEGDSGSDG